MYKRQAWVLTVATDENKLRAGADAVAGGAVSLPIAGRVVGWAAGAGAGWLLTTGLGCAARPLENKPRFLAAAGAGAGAAVVGLCAAGFAADFACLFGGALASALARLSAGFSTGDGLELRPIGFLSTSSPAFVSVSSLRVAGTVAGAGACAACLLYTSPSPRD